MKGVTIAGLLVSIFLLMPISLYLNYWVLTQLHPDRLIWFLFIMYIPILIFSTIVLRSYEKGD